MRRPTACEVAVLALLMTIPLGARADIVTFNFSGNVDTLNDSGNIFGGKINVGDPFSGSFSFDNTPTTDKNNDPNIGLYAYGKNTTPTFVTPMGLNFTIGTGANQVSIQPSYSNSALTVTVGNDQPSTLGPTDYFQMGQPTSLNGTTLLGGSSLAFIEVLDLTRTIFSSDALPLTLSPTNFQVGALVITGTSGNTALQGHLNGLGTVPEPGSLLLLGLGLAGSIVVLRRRPRVAC